MATRCILEIVAPNIQRIQTLTFDLDEIGTVVTLGRVNSDLIVQDDAGKVVAPLSRHHASFVWRDGCAYVQDNKSANKTRHAVCRMWL